MIFTETLGTNRKNGPAWPNACQHFQVHVPSPPRALMSFRPAMKWISHCLLTADGEITLTESPWHPHSLWHFFGERSLQRASCKNPCTNAFLSCQSLNVRYLWLPSEHVPLHLGVKLHTTSPGEGKKICQLLQTYE
jgi:hypothetical protein